MQLGEEEPQKSGKPKEDRTDGPGRKKNGMSERRDDQERGRGESESDKAERRSKASQREVDEGEATEGKEGRNRKVHPKKEAEQVTIKSSSNQGSALG